VICILFVCILASVVECLHQEENGQCDLSVDHFVDTQGNPIAPDTSYMLKTEQRGLVLGDYGRFGRARLVLLDRTKSSKS
jgi:hypothetical protein